MDMAHALQLAQTQVQAAWSFDDMEHLPMHDPANSQVQFEEDMEHLPLREAVKPEKPETGPPQRSSLRGSAQPMPPALQHVDPPWLVSAPEVAMDMKRAMAMFPHNLSRADFDGARDEGPRVHWEPRPPEPAGLPPSALTFADVQAAARRKGSGRGRGAPPAHQIGQHQVMAKAAGWPQTPLGWVP